MRALHRGMRTATQTICNRTDKPIYVTIELTPQAYELEPGEQLTLIYDIEVEGNALQIDFLGEDELVIWPNGEDPQVLIDDKPAADRNWKFKHR